MITLNALGPLDLRDGRGAPVATVLSQPRLTALLVYLSSSPQGDFHRRDTLMGLLWPEAPQRRARHTLNQTLYALRKALGDDVIESRGQGEIAVTKTALSCDVRDFKQAIADSRWEDAATLYRGPILEGFYISNAMEFERWLDEERQTLQRHALDALESASEQYQARGNPSAALRWAGRALELYPDNEAVLRRLLVLKAWTGDRAGALELFERFRTRLWDDYELEPSWETVEIVESIRTGPTSGLPSAAPVHSGVSPPIPAGGRDQRRLSESAAPRGLGATLAGAGAALLGVAAVSWAILGPRGAAQPGSVAPSAPVIAVVPIVVAGDVPVELGDLGRHLTAELTDRLGRIPGVTVLPLSVTGTHLEDRVDSRTLGQQLDADAIVRSSLTWERGVAVDTHAEVTEVESGEVLWQSRHRHEPRELLMAQQDITVGVASALNVRYGSGASWSVASAPDEPLEAWSYVAQARELLTQQYWPPNEDERASELVRRALAIDPSYGPAHATQSDLYRRRFLTERQELERWDFESYHSAVAAAERAISLAPDHHSGHTALSLALLNGNMMHRERYPLDLEIRRLEAGLRAAQLQPNSPDNSVGLWYSIGAMRLWDERGAQLHRDPHELMSARGWTLWMLGDHEGAIAAYNVAAEIAPARLEHSWRIAQVELSLGRLSQARARIEGVLAKDPELVDALGVAVWIALAQGRYEDAEAMIENLLSRDPAVERVGTTALFPRTALGFVYLKTDRVSEGTRLLEVVREQREDEITRGRGYIHQADLGRILSLLGDIDGALHWMRIAIDRGWPFYYTWLGLNDPMKANLRDNDAFQAMMEALKRELDADRAWAEEVVALPESERLARMLKDAEEELERWRADLDSGAVWRVVIPTSPNSVALAHP